MLVRKWCVVGLLMCRVVWAQQDRLLFLNGDQLSGEWEGLRDSAVMWRHPGASRGLSFALAGIAEVQFRERAIIGVPPQNVSVQLTNGDRLQGNLRALDSENLELETWYAGTFRIRRNNVCALSFGRAAGMLLCDDPDGWKTVGGEEGEMWELRDGCFTLLRSAHPLFRSVPELPDSVCLEFTVSWPRSPYLRLGVFVSDAQRMDGYWLYLGSSGSANLTRVVGGGSQSLQGEMRNERITFARENRFAFYADREKRLFILSLNGRPLQRWSDPNAAKAGGNGISFHPASGLCVGMKLWDIRLSRWDGEPAVPSMETVAQENEKGNDLIVLRNSDRLSGRVLGASNGVAKVRLAYATLEVPVERVVRMTFVAEKTRPLGETRAHLVGNGFLTFHLWEGDEKQLRGTSEILGEVAVKRDAVRRLEFRLGRTDSGK